MFKQTMSSLKWAIFALVVFSFASCGNPQSMTVSNKLTTFIPEEKLIPTAREQKRKIEKSTGNYLRDAIKVIHSDKRTQGYFNNISLLRTEIYSDKYSYTFSGVKSSTINDFPVTSTQQIIVDISPEQENIFYELSFGANP